MADTQGKTGMFVLKINLQVQEKYMFLFFFSHKFHRHPAGIHKCSEKKLSSLSIAQLKTTVKGTMFHKL